MRRFFPPVMLMFIAAGIFAIGPCARGAGAAYKDVLIKNVPHVQQKPDFCGEACVEMWTRLLKQPVSQDQVFNASEVDPEAARGCYTADLLKALVKIGFRPGDMWQSYSKKDAAAKLEENFAALHGDLAAGIPSIVCMHYADKPQATEHFRLILGYDAKADEVIYHEPAEAGAAYKRMARATFLKLWPLYPDAERGTLIRFRLEAGKLAPMHAAEGFSNADYAQHIMALKEKMPKGFNIVLQKPFVVVGDESAGQVRAHAERTVKWATEKLKADFFAKDPADILDVWLFKDKESYEKNVSALFGDEPDTPYGYYSASDKALIMNISTGGGTLVHEIVHPFMAANFPKCPPWFNEGLGSLFEQCGEERGHIHGATNWRLAGLQAAIKADKVPSFEKLCGMDNNQFYRQDRGTNYGQARYLCYYLQEHGLLRTFYEEFVAHAAEDPGGYNTLKKVLEEKDMDAFQKRWEKYVSKLRFP